MDRRAALRSIATASLGVIAAPALLRNRYQLFAHTPAEYSARTIALMRESTVIDMLCQFAFDDFRTDNVPKALRWRRDPSSFTEADFAQFRDSGVNVLALGSGPANCSSRIETAGSRHSGRRSLRAWRRSAWWWTCRTAPIRPPSMRCRS